MNKKIETKEEIVNIMPISKITNEEKRMLEKNSSWWNKTAILTSSLYQIELLELQKVAEERNRINCKKRKREFKKFQVLREEIEHLFN